MLSVAAKIFLIVRALDLKGSANLKRLETEEGGRYYCHMPPLLRRQSAFWPLGSNRLDDFEYENRACDSALRDSTENGLELIQTLSMIDIDK